MAKISEDLIKSMEDGKVILVKESTLFEDLIRLAFKAFVVILCAVSVFSFVFGVFRYVDLSMKPSYMDGDLVLYYRLDKKYSIGDVAVIDYKGKTVLGRISAIEGDEVDITSDGLKINGALQQQNANIVGKTFSFIEGIKFPLIVGKGQIFILGDNREEATDSRIYGCVNISDTKGTVVSVFRRRNL